MRKLFVMLLFAAWCPLIAVAQSQAVTAKWTPDQRLVLSDMPLPEQAIQLAVPTGYAGKTQELQEVCARMTNEFATWKASEDAKAVFIYINRAANPAWDKETWQQHLTRMAGVYLMN